MRIFNSIKHDGIINAFHNVLTLLKKNTYGKSFTALLEADLNELAPEGMKPSNNFIDIVEVNSVGGNNLLNLNAVKINRWLNNGAHLYEAKLGDKSIGYAVIHLAEYSVDGVGVIDLKNRDALWLGPIFVDKKYRSQGIGKQLINGSIKNYIGERKIVLTSANVNNISSIKSFISNGFKLKNVIICTYYFGGQKLVKLVNSE